MSQNRQQHFFKDVIQLKLKWQNGRSRVSLKLPWRVAKRAVAVSERDRVLEGFFQEWPFRVLLADLNGQLKLLTLDSPADLQNFGDQLQFGSWIILLKKTHDLRLEEITDDKVLMSMDLLALLNASRADCLVFSNPDNQEWDVVFAT